LEFYTKPWRRKSEASRFNLLQAQLPQQTLQNGKSQMLHTNDYATKLLFEKFSVC